MHFMHEHVTRAANCSMRVNVSSYASECLLLNWRSISSANFLLIHLKYHTPLSPAWPSQTIHRPITRCTKHHSRRGYNPLYAIFQYAQPKWLLCVFLFMAIFMDKISLFIACDGRCAPKTVPKRVIYSRAIDRARTLATDGICLGIIIIIIIREEWRQCRTETRARAWRSAEHTARYLNVCFRCHKADFKLSSQ